MSENAPVVTGYDTVLQVLGDIRKELAERERVAAEREEHTHALLQDLIDAVKAHDGTVREMVDAANPKAREGKSLKDSLKELFAGVEERLDGIGSKVDALPEDVAKHVVVEVQPETPATAAVN